MAILTGYDCLKTHFDKLILGGHRYGNNLESIRTTYEKMFDKTLNEFDVYQTNFNFKNNPITGIITLVGELVPEEYLSGIILTGGNPVYVHFVDKEILTSMNNEQAEDYALMVFNCLQNIISMDQFYGKSDNVASNNPYIATVRSYPFYFMYHHIRKVGLNMKIRKTLFEKIIERYIIDDRESIDLMMNSLDTNQYSADPEIIYAQMSDKGNVPLFG